MVAENRNGALAETHLLETTSPSDRRRNEGAAMTISCPHCYGGHFRPCQTCGDSGSVEFIPDPAIHLSDDTRKAAEEDPKFANALVQTIEAVIAAIKDGRLKP